MSAQDCLAGRQFVALAPRVGTPGDHAVEADATRQSRVAKHRPGGCTEHMLHPLHSCTFQNNGIPPQQVASIDPSQATADIASDHLCHKSVLLNIHVMRFKENATFVLQLVMIVIQTNRFHRPYTL